MTSLIHIADRVLNRPLLITRDKAEVVLSVLAGRLGVNAPESSRFEGGSVVEDENGARRAVPYRVTGDGVGIITVTGSLVNRGAWVGASSGLTSYEGIGFQLKSAAADPAVRSVILDMHSPGGEAVGAFETAALVRDLAARKRTVAVVNGMAASAMYAIASGANEIVTTETGIAGSIGVVLLHADFSRQLDRDGITPTLIHAGAHKVDANPFEPLSDAVR
ncbi:S49 family peptidase, partial [Mesorhizobium sp.]